MSFATMARERVSRSFIENVIDNPVVSRDLRTRMRGKKAFIVMGAYVIFLTIALLIRSYFSDEMVSGHFGYGMVNKNVGGDLFALLASFQTVMLVFIIPALTSGGLSIEVEKRTMEMLALTRLKAGSIVMGKHMTGFLYALVLLACSIPLSGICLMYGGISPAEISVTYLLLVFWAYLLSAVGVFWSSLFDRTASAALLSYATAGIYALITYAMAAPQGYSAAYGGGGPGTWPLLALYPRWGITFGLSSAVVCGVHISLALIAVVLHLAAGTCMLLTAMMHVRYRKADKSLPQRLLILFMSASLIWLMFGDRTINIFSAIGAASLLDMYAWVGSLFLLILGFAAAFFATGPVRSKKNISLSDYAISPLKAFKGDLGGGLTFMLLWGVVVYGAFGLTAHWSEKAAAFTLSREFWMAFCKMGVSGIAVLAGICGVGILASSAMNSRKNAVAIVMLFVILIFGGYAIVLANYQQSVSDPANPIWQGAAFWPIASLMALSANYSKTLPDLWWPKQQTWLVTSAIYVCLCAICMLWASRCFKKSGGIQED